MPAKLTVHFTRPKEIKRAEFNNMVRIAFTAAGVYWLQHYQMKHFEPNAAQRYGMAARSEAYRRRRAAKAKARGEEPANLVWSGKARDLARMRRENPLATNMRARATSNVQYVEIPLPIGHAIPAKIAGDFTKLTADEIRVLIQTAKASMSSQMEAKWREKETTVLGVAA
jgi:hypothetical protein